MNENFVYGPLGGDSARDYSPLTKDELQQITFSLGHCYGTATKVPRHVHVLQYSYRLGEKLHEAVRLSLEEAVDGRGFLHENLTYSKGEGNEATKLVARPHFSS